LQWKANLIRYKPEMCDDVFLITKYLNTIATARSTEAAPFATSPLSRGFCISLVIVRPMQYIAWRIVLCVCIVQTESFAILRTTFLLAA